MNKTGFKPREIIFKNAYRELKPGDLFIIPRIYFKRDIEESTLMEDVSPWLNKIPALAKSLTHKGVKLILIGPTPFFWEMTDIRECSLEDRERCSVDRNSLFKGNALIAPQLHELTEKHDNIFLFEPFPTLCQANQDRCYPDDGQVFLYRDREHLNTAGAKKLTRPFVQFLRKKSLLTK